MRKLVKLLISLFVTFGLFLTFNHFSTPSVEAAAWNTDMASSYGLTTEYMNDFMSKYYTGQMDGNFLHKPLYSDYIKAVMSLNIGHCYPHDINNSLTVHYNNKTGYQVVKSSGNPTIDELILSFVRGVGDTSVNNIVCSQRGTVTQPKFLVNGNEVSIYVPYVYYPKDVRNYLADILARKINMLTGGNFNVTFTCSKDSTVRKYGGEINSDNTTFYHTDGLEPVTSFVNAWDLSVWTLFSNEYPHKKFGPEPAYIRIKGTTLVELMDSLADRYGYEVNGYWQLYGIQLLSRKMFMCPYGVRIICDDWTLSITSPDDIDIEDSRDYIMAFNSGDIY